MPEDKGKAFEDKERAVGAFSRKLVSAEKSKRRAKNSAAVIEGNLEKSAGASLSEASDLESQAKISKQWVSANREPKALEEEVADNIVYLQQEITGVEENLETTDKKDDDRPVRLTELTEKAEVERSEKNHLAQGEASLSYAGMVSKTEEGNAYVESVKMESAIMSTETSKVSNRSHEMDFYVLRIFSGPHANAEIELNEQSLILGKGESCDIILMDDVLQDQHAAFSIENGKIFCRPLNGALIFVAGAAISGQLEIQPYQPIICGATLLAIGPKGAFWPKIEMPELKQERIRQPEDLINRNEDQPEMKSKIEGTEVKVSNLRKYALHLSVIIIIFVSIGIMFFVLQRKKSIFEPIIEQTAFPIVALKKSIDDVLNQHSVDMDLVKINLSGQRFVLQCYVANVQQKVELEKALHRLPKVNFQSLHIYVQEKITQQAQDMLNFQQTLIALPGNHLDEILLKGYLYSIEQFPIIKNRLLSDIPGLHTIETALLGPEEVYNLASNLLMQYNLMGLLKIQAVRNGLMIMGSIQAADETNWKNAQKALKKNFHGICKVLSYVATVAPNAVKKIFFSSPITTVSIPKHEKPWIDLKNGDRYFEGSILPSSYRIEAITKQFIRLKKNEDVIVFNLAEL